MLSLRKLAVGALKAAPRTAPKLVLQARRDFSEQTLRNACLYVNQNISKIKFEVNESGFIRTTLPDWVLAGDATVAPLASGERLRANFWHLNEGAYGMGDDSIHDHPAGFQSFIVNGGYKHEIYSVHHRIKEITGASTEEEVKAFSSELMADTRTPDVSRKFKFSIDKATKSVTYCGELALKYEGEEETKRGQVVDIDPHLIHRVSVFQAVPGEKTLSMNIVRNGGKGATNIFLPHMGGASVKTERAKLSPEESKAAAKDLAQLFSRAVNEYPMFARKPSSLLSVKAKTATPPVPDAASKKPGMG